MPGMDFFRAGNPAGAVIRAEGLLGSARSAIRQVEELRIQAGLVLFHLALGDCRRAESTLRCASELVASVEGAEKDPSWTLLLAASGSLAALCGDFGGADRSFDRALAGAPGHRALVLTLRAEAMATRQPHRSLVDARAALELIGPPERTACWWRPTAVRALASASIELGDLTAAVAVLDHLLSGDLPRQGRARALLLLGDALLRSGDRSRARTALLEAERIHAALGSRLWRAKGQFLLAQADRAAAANWQRRCRGLADGHGAFDELFACRSRLSISLLGAPAVAIDGRRCRFDTRNAEQAVYLLASISTHTIHAETLADRLWGEGSPERLAGRTRTLLWHIRRGLTEEHAWRISHSNQTLHLDVTGIDVDILQLRDDVATFLCAGPSPDPRSRLLAARRLEHRLEQPVLTPWKFDDWVATEAERQVELLTLVRAAI
jgi:tetratricopeptide (TPR) repeat protein